MISAIVAVDKKWGIGKENNLLVKLDEDMEFFKFMTMGTVVVMGMNTFKSMNYKPLPGRTNIVICRNNEICNQKEKNLIFMDKASVKNFLIKNPNQNIFIIGGGHTYQTLIQYCETVYVTKIYRTFDADVFFPNLDADTRWEKKSTSQLFITEEEEYTFTFNRYERKVYI